MRKIITDIPKKDAEAINHMIKEAKEACEALYEENKRAANKEALIYDLIGFPAFVILTFCGLFLFSTLLDCALEKSQTIANNTDTLLSLFIPTCISAVVWYLTHRKIQHIRADYEKQLSENINRELRRIEEPYTDAAKENTGIRYLFEVPGIATIRQVHCNNLTVIHSDWWDVYQTEARSCLAVTPDEESRYSAEIRFDGHKEQIPIDEDTYYILKRHNHDYVVIADIADQVPLQGSDAEPVVN
ncbi:MAG: hypothetical protein LUE86_07550 [Clostridiales bacterium]|nr:hypothetical protein [Clostridiales bacterium]